MAAVAAVAVGAAAAVAVEGVGWGSRRIDTPQGNRSPLMVRVEAEAKESAGTTCQAAFRAFAVHQRWRSVGNNSGE